MRFGEWGVSSPFLDIKLIVEPLGLDVTSFRRPTRQGNAFSAIHKSLASLVTLGRVHVGRGNTRTFQTS